ncbi:MAG: ParB N-terminal domain-containing protein, partial [Rhodospirillales bacterium]|nr:ParB N-terminal domain-containing protein [Rhodospirillales bacterium]
MTANIINTGDKIEMVAAGKLACHPDNPRRGDVESIRESISANGFYGALVVQRSTGHILAGNHRFMAAQAEGLEKFPVIYVDVDDDEAKYILVVDNRSSDKAENDQEILAAILQGLESSEQGLIGTGYSDADLAGLLAAVMADGEALDGEDDIPETPEEPVTRPGDLWTLGNHRLICGDATVATDVERLLGTVKPLLMVTDPPYGVEYDPSWRNQAGATATKRVGKVLNDDRADWREAWALFPGDVAYVWHGALHAATVAESLEESGFKVRSQIIWAKERLVLSRGDYHWQHEPCQPAGTMVQKVTERGSGSQPAQIEDVPIETLKVGDFVVSYNSYESV